VHVPSNGIVSWIKLDIQARRLEGSPLLPEGTELPAQTLEGVMRSLDMVEKALGEALLMAEAMPGPDESAIGAHEHQHAANRSQMHAAYVLWHFCDG
jgi:hypothetical protein